MLVTPPAPTVSDSTLGPLLVSSRPPHGHCQELHCRKIPGLGTWALVHCSGISRSVFLSLLPSCLALRPGANHTTSLILSFLTSEMGMIIMCTLHFRASCKDLVMNTREGTYQAHSTWELPSQLLLLFCFLLSFASGQGIWAAGGLLIVYLASGEGDLGLNPSSCCLAV